MRDPSYRGSVVSGGPIAGVEGGANIPAWITKLEITFQRASDSLIKDRLVKLSTTMRLHSSSKCQFPAPGPLAGAWIHAEIYFLLLLVLIEICEAKCGESERPTRQRNGFPPLPCLHVRRLAC